MRGRVVVRAGVSVEARPLTGEQRVRRDGLAWRLVLGAAEGAGRALWSSRARRLNGYASIVTPTLRQRHVTARRRALCPRHAAGVRHLCAGLVAGTLPPDVVEEIGSAWSQVYGSLFMLPHEQVALAVLCASEFPDGVSVLVEQMAEAREATLG
jgi:hypothetical protein